MRPSVSDRIHYRLPKGTGHQGECRPGVVLRHQGEAAVAMVFLAPTDGGGDGRVGCVTLSAPADPHELGGWHLEGDCPDCAESAPPAKDAKSPEGPEGV